MAAKRQKKSGDKWKKKKWYKIYAPKIFKEALLGETPAEKDSQVIGRVVEIPLSEIAGQKKPTSTVVQLRINRVASGRAETELIGCRVDSGYLKRITRRRKSRVDVITDVETADNKKMRITASTLCSTKIERRKETSIRKATIEVIANEAKKQNYEEFMQNILFGNIAQNVMNKVKSIAPTQRVEIVKARIIEGNKK